MSIWWINEYFEIHVRNHTGEKQYKFVTLCWALNSTQYILRILCLKAKEVHLHLVTTSFSFSSVFKFSPHANRFSVAVWYLLVEAFMSRLMSVMATSISLMSLVFICESSVQSISVTLCRSNNKVLVVSLCISQTSHYKCHFV